MPPPPLPAAKPPSGAWDPAPQVVWVWGQHSGLRTDKSEGAGWAGSRGLGWGLQSAGEGAREARKAGRARSASASSWVGVSRWPWESAGRASNCARSGWHGLVPRRRAAASPPLVQCVGAGGRVVRTPPTLAHTASSHTPLALGAGDPRRTKEEEGALLQQARGGKKGAPPVLTTNAQPRCNRTPLLAPQISPSF